MRAWTYLTLAGLAAASMACSRNQPAQQASAPSAPAPQPMAASQAPPTAVPGVVASVNSSIPDLPDYPGATRVKLEHDKEKHGQASIEAKFETPDGLDVVQGFFTAAFPANGWQVGPTSSKQSPAKQEVEWNLTRPGATAKVELESKPGGGTIIKIKHSG